MCATGVLGIYSLGISIAATRSEDNFARYERDLQKAKQEAKTLEAQLALSPANHANEGYAAAVSTECFSTTIFVASIILFLSGFVQLWAIQKIIRRESQKMPHV